MRVSVQPNVQVVEDQDRIDFFRGSCLGPQSLGDTLDKSEYDPVGPLGVDLGIENIAVDSDREVFESDKVENTRKRYSRLRSSLQHKGTRSAKRKLKRLSDKERRFKKDMNHVISKHIVSKAKDTTSSIGIENLSNIRARVTVDSSQRDRHSKWAFDELRNFRFDIDKYPFVHYNTISPKMIAVG